MLRYILCGLVLCLALLQGAKCEDREESDDNFVADYEEYDNEDEFGGDEDYNFEDDFEFPDDEEFDDELEYDDQDYIHQELWYK